MEEVKFNMKPKDNFVLPQRNCLRCSHSWIPRSEEPPITCPKCGSPYWHRERKNLKDQRKVEEQVPQKTTKEIKEALKIKK